MKFYQFIVATGLVLILSSCIYFENGLNVVNSHSLPEKQVTLDSVVFSAHILTDSVFADTTTQFPQQNVLESSLNKMFGQVAYLGKSPSDTAWTSLTKNWNTFRINHLNSEGLPVFRYDGPESAELRSPELNRHWANLNIHLLKLSGEVRFGDALEKMLYQSKVPVFTTKMLKSVIYTRVDDQIYVNIFGDSSMLYNHTTGGKVKIWQETAFPNSNEVLIKFDCDDIRYMDIYIRIPEWAKNPTVTHGNVKYVPYPGQYCEVSRKWKKGDEITVVLNN
jgi:hypothetical protein